MEKLAIIDCGTNTFHLMIVKSTNGEKEVLHKEKVAVKIGEGGISNRTITNAAQERALDCLQHFQAIIEEKDVHTVFASATSAFRNAENGTELIDKIYRKTGIKIHVISGEDEAKYIFKGVQQAVQLSKEPALIMDIGGGSVEFIIADHREIYWLQSFEIGAQRLLDKFHGTDPIDTNELEALFQYLEKELKPLLQAIDTIKPHLLVGSSGTFDTLIDMNAAHHGKRKDEQANSFSLQISDFERLYQEIITKNRTERLQIPGMIEMRVDMIVVAVGLIQFILNYQEFNKISVSTFALKEGVLEALLQNEIAIS